MASSYTGPAPPAYEPWYNATNNHPRETTPLMARNDDDGDIRKSGRTLWMHLLYVLILALLVSPIAISIDRALAKPDPLSERERENTRYRWKLETEKHEGEILQLKSKISNYERQRSVLFDKLGVLRGETEAQLAETERSRRQALEFEGRARRAEIEEKAAFQRLWEYERKFEEEEDARAKMRLYWDDLLGDEQCLGHDRIHYRALLANVLHTIDAVDACKAAPITINGVFYESPAWCEDVGNWNVYGHWIVRNEGKCSSYWEYFKDKGCLAPSSRIRRFEAPLAGLVQGQNHAQLCHTTPATILGQRFDSPAACPYWGGNGFWGIWDVRDDSC